jgi:hypothetical protein
LRTPRRWHSLRILEFGKEEGLVASIVTARLRHQVKVCFSSVFPPASLLWNKFEVENSSMKSVVSCLCYGEDSEFLRKWKKNSWEKLNQNKSEG